MWTDFFQILRKLQKSIFQVVVPAKRIRSLDDHIVKLWKNHEVAAVIEGREEFDDIDVVLDFY